MQTPMTTDLAAYYAARATEYEKIYDKPERQGDLALLRSAVTEYFRGRRVLEIACGTGYWTTCIASSALSVVATDINSEVLNVARAKTWPESTTVSFLLADALDLATVPGEFDAVFAGFWWSHIPRQQLQEFLERLHDRVGGRARIMMIDNRYVEGSSTPISRVDDDGNTFQLRALANGDRYEVLKNFPAAGEVGDAIEASGATGVDVVESTYYWYAAYDSPQ